MRQALARVNWWAVAALALALAALVLAIVGAPSVYVPVVVGAGIISAIFATDARR